MIKRLLSLLLIMFSITMAFSQAFRLSKPTLDDPENVYEGLASNGVTQIVPQGDSLTWFATGGGLSKTADFGQTFTSYYRGDFNMPRGGISAIAVLDSIIWIAGVFDSATVVGSQKTGAGLAYSKDYGETWTYIPQPIDGKDDDTQLWGGDTVSFLPILTPVSNTTWDISLNRIDDDSIFVYITSWAGGIRRSRDFGATWERIPLPDDDNDMFICGEEIDYKINPRDPPEGNHNHKGFSVLAYGDTVWVGTANGVNFGIVESDDCIRWRKYNAQNSTLAGNFIVALGRQLYKGQETIWAAAGKPVNTGETQAACKTSDGGLTWSRTLVGERIYGFGFQDSIVYACTEKGLFKSIDGDNWALYNPVVDVNKNAYIFSQDVYAACVDSREDTTYLWLGTSDGIAKTANDGMLWTVYRKSLSTSTPNQPSIYAYPNPFAPSFHNVLNGDGHVRIQYYLDEPAQIQLQVYDFAMGLVYEGEPRQVFYRGDNSETWNARNSAGVLVANGVYFCKLIQKIDGREKSYWTKLIVIK